MSTTNRSRHDYLPYRVTMLNEKDAVKCSLTLESIHRFSQMTARSIHYCARLSSPEFEMVYRALNDH